MVTREQAHTHAVLCGIDMTNRIALPIAECVNHFPATDILHPETQEIYWPAGFWIKAGDEHWFTDIGMDYVICETQSKQV